MHDPAGDNPYVHVGLRRITATGTYDPLFGLGVTSVIPPTNERLLILPTPLGGKGGNDEYNSIRPASVAWLGDKLYVIATGLSGGRTIAQPGVNVKLAEYPVLLVLRWNADGSVDQSLDGVGRQEGGYTPNPVYWSVTGV